MARATVLNRSILQHHIKAGAYRVDLYLPAVPDGTTLDLLVFIPPIDDFRLPREWSSVLEEHKLAVIVLKDAGNRHNTIERRIPLALHALANVSKRHIADHGRVYIGGFSGGARTAQIAAMAYPDLFHGALLFAGSDVVGDGVVPASKALMHTFQARSRVVLSTGTRDEVNVVRDAKARRSLEEFCVLGVEVVPQRGLGHELPGSAGFEKAIAALLKPAEQPSGLDECRAGLERKISARLDRIEARTNRAEASEKLKELAAIDALYGGLASPRSLVLGEALLSRTGD